MTAQWASGVLSAVRHILHHLQKVIAVLRQLGLTDAADLPHLGERVRFAIEDFQQGAVVKNDVGRHALFAGELHTLGFEGLPQRVFVGSGKGFADARAALGFAGFAIGGFGFAGFAIGGFGIAAQPHCLFASQHGAGDDHLWLALKAKRMELAREQGVPPYVIFHDSTLLEIHNRKPQTLDEMAQIGGVGQAKLAKYGDAFLQVVEDAANGVGNFH